MKKKGSWKRQSFWSKNLDSQRKLNFDFVVTSLRQQKINVAVAALAELSGLGVKIIWRVIREKNDEGLAVISRAIGLEKSQFSTMFLLILQAKQWTKSKIDINLEYDVKFI